ncbi:beta-ketoacyl synthase N-terminal-like domain-containing protein [Streptococcus mutans]|uniref:beta-ketoacyl synthase N-terminal-like domain-containing protein n=1 Tax=Streptococcus mutans TaxID=1309 RepID=UPI0038B95D1B
MELNHNIVVELCEIISKVVDDNDVDDEQPLTSYGINSIDISDIVNKINKKFNINLLPTIFFQYENLNITLLAKIIYEELGLKDDNEDLMESVIITSTEKDESKLDSEGDILEPSPEIRVRNRGQNDISRLFNSTTNPTEATYAIESQNMSKLINDEDIVIVGMSGRFPESDNLNQLWENLNNKNNLFSKFYEKRPWCASDDFQNEKYGGYIDNIQDFDNNFFKLTNIESDYMDPQHRLFLEEVWNTVEDSGQKMSELWGKKVGVFAGISGYDYNEIIQESKKKNKYTPYSLTGPTGFMLVNRVSSMFNFIGPSEPIDTACSSSLVAFHRAVNSIKNGECDSAIVGGVNLILSNTVYNEFENANMLSRQNKCLIFDKNADGTLRSEGIGVLYLKKYVDALRDGNHIYCSVRATSVAHKGHSTSLTAPSIESQFRLISELYSREMIYPWEIDYIESHSTGTKLGDPIEILALSKVLDSFDNKSKDYSIKIGSIKSYLGHMEAASGIGSIIQSVLSMKNKKMLGIKNLEERSELLEQMNTNLIIDKYDLEWKINEHTKTRTSAISSFGYGGVNAHIVLQDYIGNDEETEIMSNIFVLSAKTSNALKQKIREINIYLNNNSVNLNDLCFTLQTGREDFEFRTGFVFHTADEFYEKLKQLNENPNEKIVKISSSSKEITNEFDSLDIDYIIEKYIRKQDLSKVRNLWLKGLPINWSSLYKETPQKISLPGYPFERIYHWVDNDRVSTKDKKDNLDDRTYLEPDIIKKSIFSEISNLTDISSDKLKGDTRIDELGINSIILTQLVNLLRTFKSDLNLDGLYSAKTINDILDYVQINTSSNNVLVTAEIGKRNIVKLNNIVDGKPIFWIHGGFGGVEPYKNIADRVNRPFYGFQASGYMDEENPETSVEEMAKYYIELINSIQPEGSIDIGGLSFGGTIAFEICKQLIHQGRKIESLIMLESIYVDDSMRYEWRKIPQIPLKQDRIFRIANLILMFSGITNLIVSDEVNLELTEDNFDSEVISLMISKGFDKGYNQTRKIIANLEKLLTSLDEAATIYKPKPLPITDIEISKAIYICNGSGTLFGERENQFRLVDKGRKYDYITYFGNWSKVIPNLILKNVKSSSHLTLLSEKDSLDSIIKICKKTYER